MSALQSPLPPVSLEQFHTRFLHCLDTVALLQDYALLIPRLFLSLSFTSSIRVIHAKSYPLLQIPGQCLSVWCWLGVLTAAMSR